MSLDLSIIIVQYKTPELLERCISSVNRYAGTVSFEIIVVNNDPGDTSKDLIGSKFPDVIWLESGYNAGFSRANNIGIRHASGDFLLILNPDAEINEGFLEKFISFYKAADSDGKLGLLGCRIVATADHSLLIGSGEGFPSISKLIRANPLFIFLTRSFSAGRRRKYDPYIMHYTDHEIDFVSGACVMIKREKVIKGNLLLDEDFFLYSEDVEWAYRIKQTGYRNYFYSGIEVYHVNSASTGFSKSKFAQMQISNYLFYLKAYGLFRYLPIGFVLFLNFASNIVLLKKAKQLDEFQEEKAQYSIFKQYFFAIIRNYYFSSVTDRPYLKYAEQN